MNRISRKIKGLVAILGLIFIAQCCDLIELLEDDVSPEPPVAADINFTQEGQASYYADRFDGRQTASGETFRQDSLTAAHKHLPFGTKVIVTNLKNNKQVTVRINDRGPFSPGRIIDLSRRAAEKIDMIRDGVVSVRIEAALSEEEAERMEDLIGR
jgi:rare lipoprotein A